MPNIFETPQLVAQTAIAALYKQTVLGRLVYTAFRGDLAGMGAGAVITVPKPAVLTARVYDRAAGNPITLDDVSEDGVQLTVNTPIYSAVAITDENLTHDIRSFASQVLLPQTNAVAQAIEAQIAALFTALPAAVPTSGTWNGKGNADIVNSSALVGVTKARTALSKKNVSTNGRVLVAGPDFIENLLSDSTVVKVNESGTGDALVDGLVTRLRGFDIYESNFIDPAQAYAFAPEAIAYVSMAPATPRGAAASALVNQNGLGMRWLSDYDSAYLRDRSIVSVIAGGGLVDPNRVVRLRLS